MADMTSAARVGYLRMILGRDGPRMDILRREELRSELLELEDLLCNAR